MKISDNLPQFTHERALLLVTGEQSGKLYRAERGALESIEEVAVPDPRYSDREGFFKQRTKRGRKFFTIRSGSPYESKDEKVHTDFTKAISELVVRHADADALYVYCPSYFKTQLLNSMPPRARDLINFVFEGNFLKEHPFVLLEKIAEEHKAIRKHVFKPESEEARKLLHKTNGISAPQKPYTKPKETKTKEERIRDYFGRKR
jgi:hypothetical protein